MSRSDWVSALIGVILGVALGLYYAWGVSPVEYTDTSPASLRSDFRSDYLALIAVAFDGTGDLERARARLALFPDVLPADTLAALAQQRLAQGRPGPEVSALARLASALSGNPAGTPGKTQTLASTRLATSTSTPTRFPTSTRRPQLTRIPTATPGSPFKLESEETVCDARLAEPLIQVRVLDASGNEVSGVEILVVWDTGQDQFFTGLKPELGEGYGDFTMTPGTTYTVQLAQADIPVTGIQSEECTDERGETFAGSWLLVFVQPEDRP
ncbi:MAG TPA: hypothetical protein VJK02_18945 [Anaerolineales bacterium]|nr:hypothetical protein [Anaerolineales bacterium]